MSNPTSNFNWQMPTATDLVTDLPADFEVFGQAVDTSLADLKGGTTNQVLAKNSNTDMDFKWVTDATGMTNPMTTTGDTIYSSSGSTPARLGIGTAGQVLRVNSGATAPEWAAPPSGGKVLQVVTASTTTDTTIASTSFTDTTITCSITPTSATSKVLVIISALTEASRTAAFCFAFLQIMRGATAILTQDDGTLGVNIGGATSSRVNALQTLVYLDSPNTTSATTYKLQGAANSASNSGQVRFQTGSKPSTITLLEIGA